MKILYDSALYSTEGITYASRMMALQLHRHGHAMMLSDITYKRSLDPTGEFAKMYNPVDVLDDEYIYFKNTRPEMMEYIKVPKAIQYHVLEGDRIPKSWVKGMNYPHVKRVLTPSQYCKTMFEVSGVTTPVQVLPHGVDTSVYYPDKSAASLKPDLYAELSTKYKILGTGAIFGLKKEDRKGFDYLLAGVGRALKDKDNVCLILKINTRYADMVYKSQGKTFDVHNWINGMLPKSFKPEIRIITQNLTEDGMRALYNLADCTIFPSRGEGFGLCLTSDTNILTKNGTKPIKDISVKDKVISHTGKFKKVIATSKRKVNENIYHITPYGTNKTIKITGEHPVYAIQRNNQKKDIGQYFINTKESWVKAKDLKKGDCVIMPKLVETQKYTRYDLKDFDEGLCEDKRKVYYNMGYSSKKKEFSLTTLITKYGFTKPIWERARNHIKNNTTPKIKYQTYQAYKKLKQIEYKPIKQKRYNRYIPIDEDLAYLLGWYTAEGSSSSGSAGVALHRDEVEEAKDIIKIVKEKFDCAITEIVYTNKKVRAIHFNGVILHKFFERLCGKLARNKKIPREILYNKNLKILQRYIDGLFLGDGHNDGNSYTLTTVSEQLKNDVVIALLRLNKRIMQSSGHQTTIFGSSKMYNIGYSLNQNIITHSAKSWVTKNNMRYTIRKIEKKKYKGNVYNIQVEDDKSYCTDGFCVHNCPLEAQACGTPIIVTNGGGFLEYANKDNALLIDIEGNEPAERRFPYFDEQTYTEDVKKGMVRSDSFYQSQWFKVSVDSLVEKIKWAYENQDAHKKMAMDNLPNIRKNHTWDVVGDKLNKIVEEVLAE